ncbi:bolA-like protein DDB_G0274169 [Anoplophora glabripennis]|uniref:bolA-like protein DDB_G0274169 n=1 Tax=Anoplophora glabripennis TaxID=217634 RepID=UPI000874AD46|nr:bolA-like protein DDB_G0274169 [Anoplophora glabripennis]
MLRDWSCIIKLSRKITGYVIYKQSSKMSTSGTITETITNKLKEQLKPVHLDVINESYMHNVPKGAETHFKVHVVSDKFDSLPLIKRHRMINDVLKNELQNGVHALSIVAETPNQWKESERIIEPSPNCRGGFGK